MKQVVDKIGSLQLKKISGSVNLGRQMTSLGATKKVGILYDVVEGEKAAINLTKWFSQNGVKVISLGFVDEKELSTDYSPNYKTDYFCKRNLTRWNLPKEEDINRFVLEPFDYLINLYKEPSLPLMGVSAMSRAKFRIGPYHSDYIHCYDMMLSLNSEGIEDYLKELKNYITAYGN